MREHLTWKEEARTGSRVAIEQVLCVSFLKHTLVVLQAPLLVSRGVANFQLQMRHGICIV